MAIAGGRHPFCFNASRVTFLVGRVPYLASATRVRWRRRVRKTCSVRFPSGSGVRVRCRIRSSDPKSCRERLSKRGDAIQFWVEVRDRRVTHTRRTRPTRASVDASRDRSRPRGRRRGDGRTVSTGSRCAPTRDAPFSAAVIISTNSSGAAPCCSAPVATAGTSFGSSPQLNSRPMPATEGIVEVCLVASNAQRALC
jgi:hypothetical protein